MKTILTGIGISIISMLLLGSSLSFNKSTEDNNDVVPVGTVIYSILPPTQFLQANKGWAKLDGSAIDQNSELFHFMQETGILSHLNGKLPNASGMFIRNMNYNADGADPVKSRNVGGIENDAFKGHKHDHSHKLTINTTTGTTSHSHTFEDYYNLLTYHGHEWEGATMMEGDGNFKLSGIDSWSRTYEKNQKTSSNTHYHSLNWSGYTDASSSTVGDVETRPINITFYAYIKIN